eukprot:gene18124-21585_t
MTSVSLELREDPLPAPRTDMPKAGSSFASPSTSDGVGVVDVDVDVAVCEAAVGAASLWGQRRAVCESVEGEADEGEPLAASPQSQDAAGGERAEGSEDAAGGELAEGSKPRMLRRQKRKGGCVLPWKRTQREQRTYDKLCSLVKQAVTHAKKNDFASSEELCRTVGISFTKVQQGIPFSDLTRRANETRRGVPAFCLERFLGTALVHAYFSAHRVLSSTQITEQFNKAAQAPWQAPPGYTFAWCTNVMKEMLSVHAGAGWMRRAQLYKFLFLQETDGSFAGAVISGDDMTSLSADDVLKSALLLGVLGALIGSGVLLAWLSNMQFQMQKQRNVRALMKSHGTGAMWLKVQNGVWTWSLGEEIRQTGMLSAKEQKQLLAGNRLHRFAATAHARAKKTGAPETDQTDEMKAPLISTPTDGVMAEPPAGDVAESPAGNVAESPAGKVPAAHVKSEPSLYSCYSDNPIAVLQSAAMLGRATYQRNIPTFSHQLNWQALFFETSQAYTDRSYLSSKYS